MAAGGTRYCGFEGCPRPVHVDPRTGIAHDYCGRTHAQAALLKEGLGPLQAPHGDCHICALPGCGRPVYFDASVGRVHDFCGIKHAQEAEQQGLWSTSNRRRQGQASPDTRCALPGCSAPRFVELSTGHMHDFCGRTHARLAASQGLLGTGPAEVAQASMVDRVWRGRDGEAQYVISMLTNRHPKVQGIKAQFLASWKHPGPKPTVMRVYQVRNPQHVYSAYVSYKEALAAAAAAAAGVGGSGGLNGQQYRAAVNENRRWHGTSMVPTCAFGINVTQVCVPWALVPACVVCALRALRRCVSVYIQ